MDSDLMLVIGLILAALALPPVLGSLVDGRPPRAAAILIMIASGLIVAAIVTHPVRYRVADVPHVFYSVIGRIMK